MGPDNQALWKAIGIVCNALGVVVSSIRHPVRSSDRLFVLPDSMHLAKNVLSMLSSNKIIRLSPDIVEGERLDEDEVRLQDLHDLLSFEKDFELKVAFRLRDDNLDGTNQFKKMKVGTTRAVFNKRTEVGLMTRLSERELRTVPQPSLLDSSATGFLSSATVVSTWPSGNPTRKPTTRLSTHSAKSSESSEGVETHSDRYV